MLELIHVAGNTYYVDAVEAIPVYVMGDGRCILLDSGWDYERDAIEETLSAHGLTPAGIIGSHLHTDHSGNLAYFQNKYHIPIALPQGEAGLGYSELTLKAYLYIFTLEDIRNISALSNMIIHPDLLIGSGDRSITIAGVTFDVIHTPGHSPDHISIYTPDGILYLGDAILSKELISKAKAPYHASIRTALSTMESLKQILGTAILAHKGICEDVPATAAYNIKRMEELADQFLAMVTHPMTLEDILAKACTDLCLLSKQMFKVKLYERDIRSYIEYLTETNRLQVITKNGRPYYNPLQ